MQEKLPRNDDLIFVLNSGSSSLKFGIYHRGASDEEALLTGSADGIGHSNGTLHVRSSAGKLLVQREGILESQNNALAMVAEEIRKHIHAEPVAVGHRVVHGGPHLLTHRLITPQVLDELRSATHFAPIHIPQALSLIASAQSLFPSAKQFACFDDVFHQTMPEVAYASTTPAALLQRGCSTLRFPWPLIRVAGPSLRSELPERAIFAHLGNGASLCALRNRKSIDTTMGLTPAGGIPMGTRSGDLDPGVLCLSSSHGATGRRRNGKPDQSSERPFRSLLRRKRCEVA